MTESRYEDAGGDPAIHALEAAFYATVLAGAASPCRTPTPDPTTS